MAAGHVLLVDERDNWAYRIRSGAIGELQIAADAQRHAIELIVGAIFIARVGVAAVLHAVTELVEGLWGERRLQRSGINEVAKPEGIGPLNIRHGQTSFTSLPVMPVIPCKGNLLFWSDIIIYARRGEICVVVILRVPRVAVAVEVGVRNLGSKIRNLSIYVEDRLSDRVEF